jgi:hypothetical protein
MMYMTMLRVVVIKHSGSLKATSKPAMPLLLLKIKILLDCRMSDQDACLMMHQDNNYSEDHISLLMFHQCSICLYYS